MQSKVGYSLVDQNNNEIKYWGNTLGEDISIPNPLYLPNGAHVYAPTLGDYGEYKLVERWIDGDISKQFLKSGEIISFENNKILITWQYRQPNENEYATFIQKHIDKIAQDKQYADGVSLASYDSSTIPEWATEAQTFVTWRDQVWVYAFTELEKVKNGQRPQPSIEEFLQELPVITWPQTNTGATGP